MAASTVAEWCKKNRIGKTTFYELRKEGRAPATILVGKKRIISDQADEAWRVMMEAETAKVEAANAR